MKKINLTELSNEELLKEAKKRKTTFTFTVASIVLMFIVSIITIIDNDIKVLTFMPVAFIGVAVVTWKQFKLTEKELNHRNLK
ncbi:hypothetical protein [Olivibacter sitiensis]|uniref:hypothetical protein n=1 Tax=Olivibacter sitiensis TaxID=376470 RepID=UPI0004282C68|nr:hypothetical protein [Olivibacter sitiensis]